MDKNRKRFAKGMMTGVVVGATTALVVNPMINKNKKRKNKNQPKMFKTVGNTMNNVVDSLMSNRK